MLCDRCYTPAAEGDHGVGLCPLEPRRDAPAIWADDIPGGVEIAHGLCHADGTPRRFDSRSAITRACADRGLVRWTDVYESGHTKDAEARMDWQRSGEAQRQRRDRVEQRREGVYAPAVTAAPVRSNPERVRAIRQEVIRQLRRHA